MNTKSRQGKRDRLWVLSGVVATAILLLVLSWPGKFHAERATAIAGNSKEREEIRRSITLATPPVDPTIKKNEARSLSNPPTGQPAERAQTELADEQREGDRYPDDNALLFSSANPRADEPIRRESRIECWKTNDPESINFNITLDRNVRTQGGASASISAIQDQPNPGQFFQTVDATALRGKRIHFQADMRTNLASRRAGLWVRADDARGRLVAIKQALLIGPAYTSSGNVDWTTIDVELDIPPQARVVSYGLTMGGTGQTWIDNARIDVSDSATIAAGDVINPLGLIAEPADLSNKPRNLDFELGPESDCHSVSVEHPNSSKN